MASKSEVGHAKNVANFTALIQLLEEMGPMYNPANPFIRIENLRSLRDQLMASLQNLADKTAPFKTAVANRENAFMQLPKLSTRVKNSFNSFGFKENEEENVLSLVKKIRGDKAIKKAGGMENEETTTISNAQLSYTSKTSHLQMLIGLLNNHPDYIPNEAELSTSGLRDLYSYLTSLNNEAADKTYALVTARKNRNDLLYHNQGNLLSLVGPIKES